MRPNRIHAETRTGFTLVELTVVLLLIAILSAAIIPAMRGTYQDALLRSTSRELVNSFGVAYSRAVSLNQLHRVRLDTVTGRYLVEHHAPDGQPEEYVPVEDVPGCKGTLDSRITVHVHRQGDADGGDAETPPTDAGGQQPPDALGEVISFYPDGTADGVALELRDRDGFGLELQINATTARVHIAEMKRE